MRIAAYFILIAMCGALQAEQGSQISSSRVTIVGVAKGGTFAIGYASNPKGELSVQTVAGETAEQVAAKLVARAAEIEQFKLGFSASGANVVVMNSSPGALFSRSTDPGLAVPANVSKFRIRPDILTHEVVLTWEVPTPPPSVIYIRRGGRLIARVEPTTNSFRDGEMKGRLGSYTLHFGYFPNDETFQFSDVTRVECENPRHLERVELAIDTHTLPEGATGANFQTKLQKTGGISPATWKFGAGKLPDGIALGADGFLTGTPTKAGEFSFEAQVTDAEGSSEKRVFSILVK